MLLTSLPRIISDEDLLMGQANVILLYTLYPGEDILNIRDTEGAVETLYPPMENPITPLHTD